MKFIIFIIISLLFLPLVNAETSFFDQDDAFIMGNSPTGEVAEETTSGATNGGGCLTNWTCSDWSFCNNGIQIRNCTKEKAYCYADLNKKPIENQNCFVDKSGDKNNMESGEEISNSPNLNKKGIVKTISLGILIIMAIFVLIFFGYKRHRKRRYLHYGY